MKNQKGSTFAKFLNGKGFYVILFLCLAAVAVSGYILFFSDSGESDAVLEVPKNVTIPTPAASQKPVEIPLTTEIPSGARNQTEVVMSKPTVSNTDTSGTSAGEPLGAAEPVSGEAELTGEHPASSLSAPTAAFYVWPLNGEVTVSFSVDELVFSNTMEDWRVHTGVDIAASLGANVKAIGDGTVEDVYSDEMMGTTVVVNHNNGTRSVYKSLMDTVDTATGDAVFAGDVIGYVGRTADAELADAPHLHLEVIKGGAQIDPLSILP